MMQRNEGKVRKSFLNNYGEGKNLVANDNVPSRKLSKQNILQSDTSGEVFEIWDKGYKVKKINLLFFLETSLVYLGTSPDTIGKIS